MTSTGRFVTLALFGAWLIAQPVRARQDDQQTPARPTFRAGNNFVRVDVVATRPDGALVSDLTADDFDITEGGKRQTIETFKRVVVDGGAALEGAATISSDAVEEDEASRDEVRMFAIFLDDYHVSPSAGAVVRDQLARLVENALGPSDLVGIMYPLSPLASVRMSRNRAVVANAIRDFEGRKGDYKPKNVFEENYVYSTSNSGAIRRDVSFSALRALIMRMGGLKEGRKALMVVSEGYGAGGDVTQELREIGDLASRNNTAIYPVTPRLYGPAMGWTPIDLMDGLNILAERSGGRLIYENARNTTELRERRVSIGTPRSKLAAAMNQIVVDSSAYYLLGYNSTRTVPDGKFHKIEVNVKRQGLQLRYRKGYFSWRPEDLSPAANAPAFAVRPISAVETALASTELPRGRPVRTWIGMARGDNGLTRVTVAWEPLQRIPGEERREGERPVRVAVKASGPDAAPLFEGNVPEPIADPAVGGAAVFDAAPGIVQLRLSVESATGATIDSEVRNLTVADLTTSSLMMGTPVVFRARSAGEFERLKTEPQPTPVAAREFSRTEQLLIRVPLYGSETTGLKMTARLLNRAAEPIADLPISAAEPGQFQIEVTLARLAPGNYGVRIAPDRGDQLSEIVAFRVTN